MTATKISNTILLNRSLLSWEWYKDTNTVRLWIHLLLRANWKKVTIKGIKLDRGELLTSLKSLSEETGLTVTNIRTSISKLKLTNNITSKSTNKYRIIRVLKYDTYQLTSKQNSKQNSEQSNKQTKTKIATDNTLKELNQYNPFNIKHYEVSELDDLFKEFLKLRKSLKAKNTERAINGLKNKLEPYSQSIKIEMINNAIIGSWKTVYEIKGNNGGFKGKGKNELPNDIESDWFDEYNKKRKNKERRYDL